MKAAFIVCLPLLAWGDQFTKEIRPLLDAYCVRCHGPAVQTGGINFARFTDEASILHDLATWRKALRVLQAGEMPPAKPLPTPEERERLIHWVDQQLRHPDWAKVRNAGHVTLPRLNRIEYNNTIRDLTGIDLHPADTFPIDGAGESGFSNDREGLFMSPLLVEKCLAAAGYVVDEVIAAHRQPQPFQMKIEVEDMRNTETGTPKKPYGYDVVVVQNTIYKYVTFPRSGTYVFRIRAWGQSDKPDYLPGLALRVDGEMKGQDQVSTAEDAPGTYTFQAFVKRGSRRVSLHYYQARTDVPPAKPSSKPDKNARPVLSLDWVEIAGSATQRATENGSRVFVAEPGKGTSEEQAARKIFAHFATRAYRRPATIAETEVLLKYFRQARQRGSAFDDAVGLGLKAVLASPYFLFRVEGSGTVATAYRLNDYELASRLSYFLWMSMPDEPLLQLARQGKLRQPQVLDAQVRRMLQDPKSNAMVEQFFGQWLGYSEFARAGGPDRKIFPVYTDALGEAMVAESTLFFGSVMREDRSLLQLLDADYTFANEELARLYGIAGVRGRAMQRVSLTDRNRGGVLGMGSILAATSLPNRTSPVVRGKWLLEVMLGEKLPPPPANAGDLPEPGKETASLTLRQRFELHRKAEQCASCHSRIDPMGYGLENFDAVGRWREQDNGQPVDSEGVLRSGERFRGPAELKNILLARKEQFARALSQRILKFALGRELRYFDEPVTERIAQTMMEGGWRPSALVSAVVKSYPFQYQQQAPNEESTE